MKKSSTIKICARTYQIKHLEDHEFDMRLSAAGAQDHEIKAFVDYDNQIIAIRDCLTEDHKRELLLHELMHACLESISFDQTESSEKLISVLAPQLNALIDAGLLEIMSGTY